MLASDRIHAGVKTNYGRPTLRSWGVCSLACITAQKEVMLVGLTIKFGRFSLKLKVSKAVVFAILTLWC